MKGNQITLNTIHEHYFLKEELVGFCREHQLPTTGSKQCLTQLIASYLETGEIPIVETPKGKKTISPAVITPDTIVEKNFVCSQKHREFFAQQIGSSFSFKVAFQTWLKTNSGKTYQEAILAYYELLETQKQQPTKIEKQFEYNTYIRAFFAANKGASLQDAIVCWKYKKSLPGSHAYEKSDLQALMHKE